MSLLLFFGEDQDGAGEGRQGRDRQKKQKGEDCGMNPVLIVLSAYHANRPHRHDAKVTS